MERQVDKDDFRFIANYLKERADRDQNFHLDISDLGNEIGIVVGHIYSAMSDTEIRDFITGFKHGVSLTNGTH